MPLFPTQYSTLSAAALAAWAAQAYGLPGCTGRYLVRGVSDTYLLETPTAKYILKLYRRTHRSRAELAGEVELLLLLHRQGGRVAPPLADLAGEYVQDFAAAEGLRHGVLFAFAPGAPAYDLSDAQLRTVGREMGALHNSTAGLQLSYPRPTYDVARTITQPLRTLASAFADYPEGLAYLRDTAARVTAKLVGLDTQAFSYGHCHYDFLPKNFHFDAADNLTFFDFDFAGQGFLVNDVMTFFVHCFLHRFTKRVSQADAERQFALFVASYREVRPLSPAELAAIPYLGFAFWTFYLGFAHDNFEDWSNSFLSPRYLRERVGLIRQWVDWYCVF